MDFRVTIGGDYTFSDSFEITNDQGRGLYDLLAGQDVGIGYRDGALVVTTEYFNGIMAFADGKPVSIHDGLYLSFARDRGTVDVTGGAAADHLIGGRESDSLAGGAAADRLTGGGGSDVFSGVSYDLHGDTITDFSGDDRIVVTDASVDATVRFEAGQLIVDLDGTGLGEAISITLQNQPDGTYRIEDGEITFIADDPLPPNAIAGTEGDDFLQGSTDNDEIDGAGGSDSLYAGEGDDIVNGGAGDDVMGGSLGQDSLIGGIGNDTLYGGEGNDRLYGSAGDDLVWSGLGDDRVRSGSGRDVIGGGEGNDTLYAGAASDTIYGGDGSDELFGEDGNDILHGGAGDDLLIGGRGVDRLYGGAGDDTLLGGRRAVDVDYDDDVRNVLNGGAGNDRLVGTYGHEVFVFGADEGDDKISGFQGGGVDKIDLQGQTWRLAYVGDHSTKILLSGGGSITLISIFGDTPGDPEADWFL